MKIALFGGAFDPPHLGHQHVAQSIVDSRLADEVWFVPTGEHSFEKSMSPAYHRSAMLEKILSFQTKIEPYELDKQGESKTVETLEYLSARHHQHQFSWVIGSDNLAKFHLWHQWQQLLEKYQFLVFPRAGYEFEPIYPGMKPLLGMDRVEASSTDVRQRIKGGKPIESLVPAQIAAYIQAHQLYQD